MYYFTFIISFFFFFKASSTLIYFGGVVGQVGQKDIFIYFDWFVFNIGNTWFPLFSGGGGRNVRCSQNNIYFDCLQKNRGC